MNATIRFEHQIAVKLLASLEIESVKNFFNASEFINRLEFGEFVKHFVNSPYIHYVSGLLRSMKMRYYCCWNLLRRMARKFFD